MFELIEKLRQKSDRTKKQIAFLIAFLIAGIIFVIWLSVIYPNWRSAQLKDASVPSPTPSSAISDTFGDGFKAIGEQFKKIKEAVSSFSTQVEYYKNSSSTDSAVTQ